MYRGVTEVRAIDDYRLILKFDNNEYRLFDLKPYLGLGRFAELRDINVFKQIGISFDTVAWKNGLDLDPEFLYAHSQAVSAPDK